MRKSFALILVIAICVIQTGCQNMPVSTVPSPEGNVSEQEVADDTMEDTAAPDIDIPEGYHLVWNDEFDGDKLSEDDWNYEAHEPGWVNHELQEYIPSDEYAFVKDGNLVIKPVKIEESGLTA